MPRSGIREIFDLASTIPGAIHLEMGEPNFDTPSHIRAAAADAAEAGYTRYTPNAGIPELREALADKVTTKNGLAVDASQIVVTPGAIAALFGCALALCEPGDEILIGDPSWPNYRMIADLLNLRFRYFTLAPENGMQPSAAEIEPLITDRTKLIVLNSPSNPTGTVMVEAVAREVLQLATDNGLWVVSDEVYDEIRFDGLPLSLATLGGFERVVSVYSFSKTYAMTGWRVGYAAAPPDLAPFLIKTQEPTNACVNAPAQMAALAALTGPQDCVGEMQEAYRRRRDQVLEILEAADVPGIRPQGAFYVWVDIGSSGLSDLDFARRLLLDSQVAITPGSAFGPSGMSFVRLSLATQTDELIEGVMRLGETMSKLRL